MPSGIEEYGQTTGLDETTLNRIQTGFDEIRAVAGWGNFRIPSYVWNWVGQDERDRILALLTTSLWDYRDGVDLPAGVPKTAHFVFLYVLFIWAEWWYDMPDEDKPEGSVLLAGMQSDWGFADWAFTDGEYGDNFTVADLSIDGYDELDGFIHHPYHDGPSYETNAWYLSCWGFFLFHKPADALSYSNIETGVWYYPSTIITYNVDIDGGEYYFFSDTYPDYVKTLLGEYDDKGIPAIWGSSDSLPVLANGEYEVLSGRATIKSFGLMDGEATLTTALDVGDTLTVARGDTPLFSGVVTNVRANLVEGTYVHEIADPVTAQGGEVEYTSGNAISAMQDAIEACGGTFETAMDTEETVFYPESPVDAWQFFRAVSYAVGGVLQYGRDGVYRLVEGGSGHSVTDRMIIGDDRLTIGERTKDYANRVAASVDQQWQTEAVENTIESYSGAGASVSITRFGEQVLIESVNFSAGEGGKLTTYSYDSNGYRIEISETTDDGETDGAEKRTRTVTVSGISEDGNQYTWSETIKTYRWLYNYGTEQWGWEQQGETTLLWKVDLEGISSVEEIEYGLYLVGGSVSVPMTDGEGEEAKVIQVPIPTCPEFVSEGLYPRYRWVATVVSNPTAGPLEGHTSCAEYLWTYSGMRPFAEGFFNACVTLGWWRNPSSPNKSYSVPSLQMFAPEDTHEVHILAKAEDPDAIDALGEYEYECQAVSLDTETGMQAFALGVLFEKGRIRHANVSVANDDYLSGDSVIWRGLEWQIDTVTVDLDRCSDIIEMVTTSTLARLQNSISREPVSWIEDVKNVVTKRTGLYDNVSRGRILSQVGFRRYLVQAEGKASPVEAKALTDDPHLVGGSVLLVRPSGKGQPWTLLSLSKEQGIVMPDKVTAQVTPDIEPSSGITEFLADITDPMPGETVTLSWNFVLPSRGTFAKVVIHDGQGESYEITDSETKSKEITYTEAEDPTKEAQIQFTPTITLVINYGEDPVEYEPFELENAPIVLTYLSISMSVVPLTGNAPFEPTIGITVIPSVSGDEWYSVNESKIRFSAEEEYSAIPLQTQQTGNEYEDVGGYEISFVYDYENGRGFKGTDELTETVYVLLDGVEITERTPASISGSISLVSSDPSGGGPRIDQSFNGTGFFTEEWETGFVADAQVAVSFHYLLVINIAAMQSYIQDNYSGPGYSGTTGLQHAGVTGSFKIGNLRFFCAWRDVFYMEYTWGPDPYRPVGHTYLRHVDKEHDFYVEWCGETGGDYTATVLGRDYSMLRNIVLLDGVGAPGTLLLDRQDSNSVRVHNNQLESSRFGTFDLSSFPFKALAPGYTRASSGILAQVWTETYQSMFVNGFATHSISGSVSISCQK